MKKRWIMAVLTMALLAGCGKDAAEDDGSSRSRDREEKEEEEEEEGEEPSEGGSEEDENGSGEEIPDGKTDVPADENGMIRMTVTQEVTERKDENGIPLFYGSYPHINVDTAGYDKLDEVIDRMNVSYFNTAEDTASEFVTDWGEVSDDTSFFCGAYENTVQIVRADDAVVSMLNYIYVDFGGVHPSHYYTCNNIDTARGETLLINDVLNSGEEETLAQLIEDDLYARYEQDIFFNDISDSMEEIIGMTGLTFTLGNDSLTVYFSPYEIAPYAYGEFIVELPYDKYPGLVKEIYTDSLPEDYMTMVRSYDMITLRDGREIHWTTNWGGYGDAESITFTENGKEQTIDIYAYNLSMYVAYIEDKTYLYVDLTRENDAHFLKCLDISGDTITEEGEITGGFYATPYDPDQVQLSTFSQMMSSSQIWQYRLVTPDGQLVPADGIYYFVNSQLDRTLTLKETLTVSYREEFTDTASEEIELGAGNELYFYATDNQTYVDFLLEGRGGYVRLYLDSPDEWPQTVDGIDIEELFDGVVFGD